MAGAEALPGLTHYYRGNDPSAWATNVPTFGRVRATGIYPASISMLDATVSSNTTSSSPPAPTRARSC